MFYCVYVHAGASALAHDYRGTSYAVETDGRAKKKSINSFSV